MFFNLRFNVLEEQTYFLSCQDNYKELKETPS